jgi:hypothetical protein
MDSSGRALPAHRYTSYKAFLVENRECAF